MKLERFKNFKVDKKNLFPFITPTSKGTSWFDPPPENKITNRQIGRMLLQFHQVAEIINNDRPKDLKFLDVGTGNCILPELISRFFYCKKSIGIDPFEDGEHITSWPSGTRGKILKKALKYVNYPFLNFDNYKHLIKYEGFSKQPSQIKIKKGYNNWKFKKKYIHELGKNEKFNFIFAKCIDHIGNWENLFREISLRSEKNTTLLIKHNSFFSYNGAHRYASTFIPWGHVLLSEKEYQSYSKKYHSKRSGEMIDFYFKGLSYPRNTIDQLFSIINKLGWKITHIEQSNKKDYKKQLKLAGGGKKLFLNAKKKFPTITLSELISDRIIIIAKKL